jgi:pyruvate dehydrogenase E1 component
VADLARPHVPAGRAYTSLGTDGFGRSDTRASLRAFFEVDCAAIVNAALAALGKSGGRVAAAPPWKR